MVKDEDLINMSLLSIKTGIFYLLEAQNTGATGFKLGEFSYPYELSMDIIIELYDREMALAFVNGLKKVGYTEARYAIEDRRVYVRCLMNLFLNNHTLEPPWQHFLVKEIIVIGVTPTTLLPGNILKLMIK